MITSRKEHFGYTLFDTNVLRHKFVSEMPNGFKVPKEKIDHIPFHSIIRSPIRIYYEITNLCNLRCKHCLNDSGKKLEDELSLDEILQMIEQASAASVFDIRISGGEPTMKEGWDAVFRKMKELEIVSSINTNGTYGKRHNEIINKFATTGITQITLSLEGRKQHHDNIRGIGNYDQVVKTASDLHSIGMNLRFNTVLMRDNIDDFKHVLDLAAKYCTETSFFYMRPSGRAKDIVDMSATSDDLAEFRDEIVKLQEQYKPLRILFNNFAFVYNSIHENKLGLLQGYPDGFTRISIVSNGDVYPNCYLRNNDDETACVGNIREHNFSVLPIWHHSNKLWQFRRLSNESQRRCNICNYLQNKECSGEPMELMVYRQKHGNNPYCKLSQLTVKGKVA